MRKAIFTLLLTLLFLPEASYAQSALTKNWLRKCKVTGLVQLRQYVIRGEFACYTKSSTAKANGYLPFSKIRNSRFLSSPRCNYLAVPALNNYFSQTRLRCFSNTRQARRAKYVHLRVPTPTPTPTSTFTPTATPTPLGENNGDTPTPTPTMTATPTPTTPPGDPIHFTFRMGEDVAGSGLEGNCTADLNGARTELAVSCTHNVSSAAEAHLHIIPNNDSFCTLATPPLSFNLTCSLTGDQGNQIAAGNGLMSVHLPDGDPRIGIAGLIRNF